MEQKLFEEYMSGLDSTSSKRAGLSAASEQKKQRLQPRRALLESLEDADSFKLTDQVNESRQVGYDSYETYHPGQLEDPIKGPATRRRLDRQKIRYSEEFGKPLREVTDEDIYRQGTREGLQSLYNMTKAPGDAEWTPGEISPDWYRGDNPNTLGSTEHPINAPIDVVQDGQGTYGRHLTTAFNPNTGENVNLMNENQYNPALYTPEGKFDKAATSMRKMDLAAGRTGLSSPKDISSMSLEEKNQYMDEILGKRSDSDGMIGESADIVQSAGVKSLGDYLNLATKASESKHMKPITKAYNKFAKSVEEFFGGDQQLGLLSDDGKNFLGTGESIDKVRSDEGQSIRDTFAGVKPETRQKFSQDMNNAKEQWVSGNYADSISTAVPNLLYMLAESTPEMGELMMPGGTALVTAKRLSNQSEEFEKNNGRPMTFEEMAKTGAAIAATLVFEKALVKTGVSGAIGNTGKRLGIKGRVGAVAGSAAGETVQEYAEGVQEEYATQKVGDRTLKEIATDPEMAFQGAVGGLMGGALRGAGEATGTVVGAPGRVAQAREEAKQLETGEYLVGEYADLADALDGMSVKEATDTRTNTQQAKEILPEMNSIQDMAESGNATLETLASNLENERKEAKTYEEQAAVEEKFEKINSNFDKYKSRINEYLDVRNKEADAKVKEFETVSKNYKEGRKKAPKELSEETIDTVKINKENQRGKLGILKDILTLSNKKKSDIMKKLNTYSDKSLNEAYKDNQVSSEMKNYIKAVQNKRADAKKKLGVDVGSSFQPRDLDIKNIEGKELLNTLKKAVLVKSYSDTRDFDAVVNLINKALETNMLTEKQAEIMQKRLEKIGKDRQAPSKEQLKAEQEAETKAKETFKDKTDLTDESFENLKPGAEVTPDSIEKELDSLKEEMRNISVLSEEDMNRQETKDKINKIIKRTKDLLKMKNKFTQHEEELNERGSATDNDWFYKEAKEYNPLEGFSKKEKKILGIC